MPLQATIVGSLSLPLRFDLQHGPAVWRVEAHPDGDRVVLWKPELIEPADYVPFRGIETFPVAEAQLAVEVELYRLSRGPLRSLIAAAGFTDPQPPRRSRSGRKRTPTATLAVRARRALEATLHTTGAEEKTLTAARRAGLLEGRRWTTAGRDLLATVDAAKDELLELLRQQGGEVDAAIYGPALGRYSPDVVNAAVADLAEDSLISAAYANATTKRLSRLVASRLRLLVKRRAERRTVPLPPPEPLPLSPYYRLAMVSASAPLKLPPPLPPIVTDLDGTGFFDIVETEDGRLVPAPSGTWLRLKGER